MKTRTKTNDAPTCIFCKRSSGVQFAIFNPRFEPFGTACVECEEKIPLHITKPEDWQPGAAVLPEKEAT